MEHSGFREEIQIEEHPYSYDHTEPKGSALFLFGGATVLILLAVGVGLTWYYNALVEDAVFTKVLSVENDQLKALRATEERELSSYGRVEGSPGKFRMPISRAMQLVAQESAENRPGYPTNAYAVKTPEQLAGQVPAVSQAGAAAANAASTQGNGSNPNAQQPVGVK